MEERIKKSSSRKVPGEDFKDSKATLETREFLVVVLEHLQLEQELFQLQLHLKLGNRQLHKGLFRMR